MAARERYEAEDYPYSDYGETDEEDLKFGPFHSNRVLGRAKRLYTLTGAYGMNIGDRYQRAVLLFVPPEKRKAHISEWSAAAKSQLFAGFMADERKQYTDPTSVWEEIKDLDASWTYAQYLDFKKRGSKSPSNKSKKRKNKPKAPPSRPKRKTRKAATQPGTAKDVRPAQSVPTSPTANPAADAPQEDNMAEQGRDEKAGSSDEASFGEEQPGEAPEETNLEGWSWHTVKRRHILGDNSRILG